MRRPDCAQQISNTTFLKSVLVPILFVLSFCNSINHVVDNKDSQTIQDTLIKYGDWKIVKLLPGYITEITEEDAQKYIGKLVTLKYDIAIINGDTCNKPSYKLSKEDSNRYFYSNNRIDKRTLNKKKLL